MAKQNLSDQELSEFISLLFGIINPNDSKKLILELFNAFVCVVANDNPERTKEYLEAIRKLKDKLLPSLKLVT